MTVELLERDGALAALCGGTRRGRRGDGRVVFVTGEPGIGKTSLVTRFVRELGADARVLLGTCDDLSIPRPLGPIRDLVGSVSPALEEALAAGAAPHEIQTLLIAELELPPRPTVLVLEDVHWADDATLDAITVLGRRIGSLPALLVLTFRGGEAPPGHPLHATVGAIRAERLARPRARAAVGGRGRRRSPATARTTVYAATGGNPFYVTELLASRTRRRAAAVGRERRARARRRGSTSAARRLVELVSVVPSRVRTSRARRGDAGLARGGGGARAPAAARGRRRATSASATSWRATRSGRASRSRRAGGCTARSSRRCSRPDADPADIVHHAEAAGAEDVVADYALVAARRAAALELEPRGVLRTTAAPPTSSTGCRRAEQAAVLEELADRGLRRRPARRRVRRRSSARSRSTRELGDAGRGRPLHARRSRASTGSRATATRRGRRRARRSRSSSRSASRSSSRAPTAASRSSRCSRRTPSEALAWGERALELATRLGDERTRAHALINIGTRAAPARPRARPRRCSRRTRSRTRPATGTRRRARSSTSRYTLMLLGAAGAGAARTRAQALAYAQEHEEHTLASYSTIDRSRGCGCARASGTRRSGSRAARSSATRPSPQLLAKTVLAELAVRRGDDDAAERLADLAAQADRTGELQRIAPVARAGGRVGADARRADAGRAVRRSSRTSCARAATAAGAPAAWSALGGRRRRRPRARRAAGRRAYAAMAARDWQAAADAFGEVGWAYDRALMLSLLDDEESLVEAIEIARGARRGAAGAARRRGGCASSACACRTGRARRRGRTRPG